VHPRCFLPIVELLRINALPVAVGEEIDRPRRHHANKGRAKSLEQRSPAFNLMDREEDLEGFAKVEEAGAERGEVGVWGYAQSSAVLGELALIEVGLKAGFENVKGRC
jgi:hypothetical protein